MEHCFLLPPSWRLTEDWPREAWLVDVENERLSKGSSKVAPPDVSSSVFPVTVVTGLLLASAFCWWLSRPSTEEHRRQKTRRESPPEEEVEEKLEVPSIPLKMENFTKLSQGGKGVVYSGFCKPFGLVAVKMPISITPVLEKEALAIVEETKALRWLQKNKTHIPSLKVPEFYASRKLFLSSKKNADGSDETIEEASTEESTTEDADQQPVDSCIMELVPGTDLQTLLSQKKNDEGGVDKLRRLFVKSLPKLCLGLHQLGLLRYQHNDIKLENLLLDPDSESPEMVLVDWELGSPFGESRRGTYHTLAPERLNKQVFNDMADMWSLGTVVVECLTNSDLIRWWEQEYCAHARSFYSDDRLRMIDVLTAASENQVDGNMGLPDLGSIGNRFKCLVQRMLKYDPKHRISFLDLNKEWTIIMDELLEEWNEVPKHD